MANEWIKQKPGGYSSYVQSGILLKNIKAFEKVVLSSLPKKHAKYYIQKLGTSEISKNCASVTVIKAVKNGHTDIEIFLFVNPMNSITVYDRGWKNKFYLSHNTENFVLDLDNCPFDSIDELIAHLIATSSSMPELICKTSQNSFHLLYKGRVGDWSLERRYGLAKRISECPLHLDDNQVNLHLRSFGIDVGHLKRDISQMKIRVGGTINLKKSNSITKEVVIVDFWINPKVEKNKDLQAVENNKVIIINDKRKYSLSTKKKINFLFEKFLLYCSEEQAIIASEIVGSGWNKLLHQNCRIWQEGWGILLGCGQYSISRLLTKLRKLGVLGVSKEYEWHKRARTYGPGLTLQIWMREYLEKFAKKFEDYDIDRPYLDGQVHEHILKDIRSMTYYGWDEDQTVEYIKQKQKHRPFNKQRTEKSLRKMYRSNQAWLKKNYPNLAM